MNVNNLEEFRRRRLGLGEKSKGEEVWV